MDEQRALLDQLMGSQRDVPEDRKRQVHFYDKEIDKFWLLGVQPFDLFRNTSWSPRLSSIYRGSMGWEMSARMGREQPLALLPEWNALSQDKQDNYGYEHELWLFLESLIRSCDKNVEKARDAHERNPMDITAQDAQQLLDLETKIKDIQQRSEAAAERGDVDVSLALLAEVDGLEKQRTDVLTPQDDKLGKKKVLVCEVSGNVVQNTEIRIQEHYQGRLYLGWKLVRDRVEAIGHKYKDKPHPNPHWRPRGAQKLVDAERGAPRPAPADAAPRPADRERPHRRDDGPRRDRRDGDDRRDRRGDDDDRRRRDRREDRDRPAYRRRRSRSRSRGRSRYHEEDDDPRSRYYERRRDYR